MNTRPARIDTGSRNSTLAAFGLSAVLFACLFLTGCGGGEPENPTDDGYISETGPDQGIPKNPCAANPIACK